MRRLFGVFLGVVLVSLLVFVAGLSLGKIVHAQTSRSLECEHYFNDEMATLRLAEDPKYFYRDSSLIGMNFAKSAAYGIAYQNCIARNK